MGLKDLEIILAVITQNNMTLHRLILPSSAIENTTSQVIKVR